MEITVHAPALSKCALEGLVYFLGLSQASRLVLGMNGISLSMDAVDTLNGMVRTGQGALTHLTLRLGGCSLHDKGFGKVVHLLVRIASLNAGSLRRLTLDVRSNTLTSHAVDILLRQAFEALVDDVMLHTLRLRLSFNPLSDGGVPNFLGRLTQLTTLTLTLDNCFIRDDGLRNLVPLGTLPVLARLSLQLSWNILTMVCVGTLLSIARAPLLTSLKLYLSCNDLRDSGLRGLNDGLWREWRTDQHLLLDVRDNNTSPEPGQLIPDLLENAGNHWHIIY